MVEGEKAASLVQHRELQCNICKVTELLCPTVPAVTQDLWGRWIVC
jgi:hypothetical protein